MEFHCICGQLISGEIPSRPFGRPLLCVSGQGCGWKRYDWIRIDPQLEQPIFTIFSSQFLWFKRSESSRTENQIACWHKWIFGRFCQMPDAWFILLISYWVLCSKADHLWPGLLSSPAMVLKWHQVRSRGSVNFTNHSCAHQPLRTQMVLTRRQKQRTYFFIIQTLLLRLSHQYIYM